MRSGKLSYLILVPFVALLLTVLVLLGTSDEISLADFFRQSRYGTPQPASLHDLWHGFQLTVDSFLFMVLNGKLIFFFFVSLLATIMTGLFAWKAFQVYRTAAPTPISLPPSLSKSADRKVTRLGLPASIRRTAWGSGFVGKLGGTLSALLVLLGLVIFVTVYYQLYAVIQSQVSQRALTTAMNLSNAAAAHVSTKKKSVLHTLVGKYSIAEEVAYIFMTDGKGRVLVHNLSTFPSELQRSSRATAPYQRFVHFRGDQVLETGVPIRKGRLGVAYYGIWKAAIDQQFYHDLGPVLGIVLVAIVAGVVLSIFQARRIARPILVLKEGADRMSRGEFDKPVGVQPIGDLGGLASSLERLRSSLNAAFVRLNRE